MSQQAIAVLELTVVSAGVITQRRFVGYDGNQASAQGQGAVGVSRMAASAAGQPIPVVSIGTAIVEAGGVLTPGQRVISDAQGRAIASSGPLTLAAGATAVTSTAANGSGIFTGSSLPESVLGTVLPGQAAAGAGAFVEILLR